MVYKIATNQFEFGEAQHLESAERFHLASTPCKVLPKPYVLP